MVAGKVDDLWLPGDVSTLNRNLIRVSIGELEEECNRKAQQSFNVIKKDNIAIAAIEQSSSVCRRTSPSVKAELFI